MVGLCIAQSFQRIIMNILDYLETEFATFEEKPFNAVDSLILSQFTLVRLEDFAPTKRNWKEPSSVQETFRSHLYPSQALHFHHALRAEIYDTLLSGFSPDLLKQLVVGLAASPRFRDMKIYDCANVFDEENPTQFAAMTFVYKNEFAYIGYRSTDRSFTGWYEDFNMTYCASVPSQELSLRYLEAMAPHLPKRLLIGGHSKGGNLAQYAALHVRKPIQNRLECIYDHDGPGFREGTVDLDEYSIICDRVHKTVPYECMVGMFMETPVYLPIHVVKSADHAMGQHIAFNWKIDGDDFVYADSLSEIALSAHAIVEQWLAKYTPDEKERIVGAVFKSIEASSALDAADLLNNGIRSAVSLIDAAKKLELEDRDIMIESLTALVDLVAQDAKRGIIDWFSPFSGKSKGKTD